MFLSDTKTRHGYDFPLYFLHELLMSFKLMFKCEPGFIKHLCLIWCDIVLDLCTKLQTRDAEQSPDWTKASRIINEFEKCYHAILKGCNRPEY